MYAENGAQDFSVANKDKGEIMMTFGRRVETLCRNNGEAMHASDGMDISDEEDVEVNHVMLAIFVTC